MRMRSQWPAIVGYSLVGAATQLVWLNFAGVTTVAADHYNVSESAIGWLAQVFPLLYVVLAIPCGLLLDRWFRPALIAGAVLTALGALVRLIGDDFSWLLAGQILASIAQPLVLNAVTGITGRYLSEKDRPTGIAVGTASIFAGMVIAFLLSAIFTTASSLPTMLWVTAIFCVLSAVVLAVVVRRPGPFEPSNTTFTYFAYEPLTPQEALPTPTPTPRPQTLRPRKRVRPLTPAPSHPAVPTVVLSQLPGVTR